ncbi:conserved hypothetical protein [delta proteobacterium NaphS2]|nr:conserved hypothetical protein [delta proteobacterium NaphS2]
MVSRLSQIYSSLRKSGSLIVSNNCLIVQNNIFVIDPMIKKL